MARETYTLNGATEFSFPHRVRVKGLLTVEVRPGGVVPPTAYSVIGAGPNSTGVTVVYPGAPFDPTLELVVTRYTPASRLTVFQQGNVTPNALNAEFDHAYDALGDFAERFGSWEGDWVTGTFYDALASVRHPTTGSVYTAVLDHQAGADFDTDIAAGKWRIVIDFTAELSGGFVVNGPITGTAVTQDPADTTADRLLKVGDAAQQVETIAALRGVTGMAANMTMRAKGYYAPGDGGGGPVRVYKAGAAPGTYVDNGGSIIVPTGGDGSAAWVWEYSGPVNARWFGAKGDGVADDTAAIQSAIDRDFYSSVTYTPQGTFRVSTLVLDYNQELFGDGKSSVLRKIAASNTPIVKIVNTNNSNAVYTVTVRDLTLYGHSTTLDPALSSADGIRVTDDPDEGGLYTCRVNIINNHFNYLSGNGVRATGITGSNISFNDFFIIRGVGVYFRTPHIGVGFGFCNAIRITHNRIKHCSIGIYGSNMTTEGRHANPAGTTLYEVFGNTVSHNLIESNRTAVSGDVWNYTVDLGLAARPGIGILLEGASNWDISSNWFEAHYQHIKLNGLVKATRIVNNFMGYMATATGGAAPAGDAAGHIVFAGAIDNSQNIIQSNRFVDDANRTVGGTYEGDQVLFTDITSQRNIFLDNSRGDGDRTVVLTAGALASDAQIIHQTVYVSGKKPDYSLQARRFYTPDLYLNKALYPVIEMRNQDGQARTFQVVSKRSDGNAYNTLPIRFGYAPDEATATTQQGSIELGLRTGATGVDVKIYAGNFTPEASVTANVGSIYLRTDGGAGTTLYVKESGVGNTGWVAK